MPRRDAKQLQRGLGVDINRIGRSLQEPVAFQRISRGKSAENAFNLEMQKRRTPRAFAAGE